MNEPKLWLRLPLVVAGRIRSRYEALVTDAQHLRDAATVHYGSQGAAR